MGKLEGQPIAQKAAIGMGTAESTQAFTERCMAWWNSMVETVLGAQDDQPADTDPDTTRNSTALGQQVKEGAVNTGDVKNNQLYSRWRNVLIVSHGGVIGFLLQFLVARGILRCADPGVRIGRCFNASISVVDVERRDGTGVVVQYADISHLVSGGSGGAQLVVNPDEIAMAQATNDEIAGSGTAFVAQVISGQGTT
jgi:hypothetical protein